MSQELFPNQTEGIILRVFPSRDADLVVRILTPEHGKISALAKHNRGSKKRFGGGVDVFDHGTFELREARGSLPLLSGFHSAIVYNAIRSDLNKIGLASCLCEAADHLMLEGGHSQDQEFSVVSKALRDVDSCENLGDLLAATYGALSALLEASGFMDDRFSGRGSSNQLVALIHHLEECTEKRSATLQSVLSIIEDFRRSVAPAA